jgi:anti-sigma regulatory factor (Ser/Thr protein kinase)
MEVVAGRAFDVSEATQAGEARRGAMHLARSVGLDDEDAGKVGLVVTEAATNMVKHASGGRLLVQPLERGALRGVGALAIDRGPGMSRLPEMMRDGFSTTGTNGTGLGAIARQSSQFDVYSVPGRGTALYASIWSGERAPTAAGLAIGAVSMPLGGERVCGDGWAVASDRGRTYVLLTDGLGHGAHAHQASMAAEKTFREHPGAPLEDTMSRLHDALRPTRGAAAAIVEIDPARGILRFCGVGNISGRLIGEDIDRMLVSHFGTLGHDVRHMVPFEYPWSPGTLLILHSDGLSSHWKFDDYPGLWRRDPTLVAGVLFRDHARMRDDCTVVVVREAA